MVSVILSSIISCGSSRFSEHLLEAMNGHDWNPNRWLHTVGGDRPGTQGLAADGVCCQFVAKLPMLTFLGFSSLMGQGNSAPLRGTGKLNDWISPIASLGVGHSSHVYPLIPIQSSLGVSMIKVLKQSPKQPTSLLTKQLLCSNSQCAGPITCTGVRRALKKMKPSGR